MSRTSTRNVRGTSVSRLYKNCLRLSSSPIRKCLVCGVCVFTSIDLRSLIAVSPVLSTLLSFGSMIINIEEKVNSRQLNTRFNKANFHPIEKDSMQNNRMNIALIISETSEQQVNGRYIVLSITKIADNDGNVSHRSDSCMINQVLNIEYFYNDMN